MINLNEGIQPMHNLSDEKAYGTMTNRVGNTMGQLEISPMPTSDHVNSTRHWHIN